MSESMDRDCGLVDEMAKIGGTPKAAASASRSLSSTNRTRIVPRLVSASRLFVKVDEMGNMFARRAGVEDNLPLWCSAAISIRSRPRKFDGVLGVLGALEVVRSLNDSRSRHAIRSRSPTGPTRKARASRRRWFLGVFAGVFTKEFAYARVDPRARRSATNLSASVSRATSRSAVDAARLFELHIEQDRSRRRGYDVGIVTMVRASAGTS